MFELFGVGPLTWITFLPIIGMIIIAIIPSGKDEKSKEISHSLFRWATVLFTFLQLILAIVIYVDFDFSMAGINNIESFQFVEKYKWIEVTGLPLLGDVRVEYFMFNWDT